MQNKASRVQIIQTNDADNLQDPNLLTKQRLKPQQKNSFNLQTGETVHGSTPALSKKNLNNQRR